MSDFSNLMGIGFGEAQKMIGTAVSRNGVTVKGTFLGSNDGKTLDEFGFLVETGTTVEILATDAAILKLPTDVSCYGLEVEIIDRTYRIVGVAVDDSDPCVRYTLKAQR